MTNHTNSAWSPSPLTPEQTQTRSAAAAWFFIASKDNDYADLLCMLKNYLSEQSQANESIARFSEKPSQKKDIRSLLKLCFPKADLNQAEAMAMRHAPYQDITDELLDEIMQTTHTEGYEILPWREASLRVLALEFMANLKSSSAQLTEDAIIRTTSMLNPKLRGTTKNACQLIAGQRTRLRKAMRMIVLASLYLLQYSPSLSLEELQSEVMQLVQPCPDPDFIRDEFPFDGFFADDGTYNARGRFAFCQAALNIRSILEHRDQLDELIQNSSKRWRIPRMALVDLNILRLATYELYFERISTPRILINEAVELAKIFGADQSKNFINGILQQLCNDNNISVA
jgi:N utilization substance protein B